MASTEDEINSLIRTRSYASKEDVISDAIKALLKQKPELKKEILIKETDEKPPKEDRMILLEKYIGITKLKKPLSLEEILDLEDDNWLY